MWPHPRPDGLIPRLAWFPLRQFVGPQVNANHQPKWTLDHSAQGEIAVSPVRPREENSQMRPLLQDALTSPDIGAHAASAPNEELNGEQAGMAASPYCVCGMFGRLCKSCSLRFVACVDQNPCCRLEFPLIFLSLAMAPRGSLKQPMVSHTVDHVLSRNLPGPAASPASTASPAFSTSPLSISSHDHNYIPWADPSGS